MDREKLAELRAIFALAEHRLKVVETHTEFLIDDEMKTGLLVPTINQLRYAGQHLFEYVVTENKSDLDEIESHCKRALYDAYQVELLFYLKQFRAFQNEFSKLIISEVVPDYLNWADLHDKAQGVIRGNVESPDRAKYYGLLVPHIDELSKIHPRLPRAREELLKKRRLIKRKKYTVIAVITFGFITAATTLVRFGPDIAKRWSTPATVAAPITLPK